MDPLDALDIPCTECGALTFDHRCRNCGHETPIAETVRPTAGDDLPGIGH